jgi:lysozyme
MADPLNPPPPAGARLLRQPEVTPAESAWAETILEDPTDYPYLSVTAFPSDPNVIARVEFHNYSARLNQYGKFRGVTLYELAGVPAAALVHPLLAEGIDVSDYQGDAIDWHAVAESGRVFAFMRASDGLGYSDKDFAKNWAGSADAGLIRGAYHYFRPKADPISQARRFIEIVSDAGLVATDMPLVVDVETLDGEAPSAVVDGVIEFLDELSSARTDRRPIVYTMPGLWTQLPARGVSAIADLWIADWGVSTPPALGPWGQGYAFWQYSSTAAVPGVPGHMDVNRFAGSAEALKSYAETGKLIQMPAPPPSLSSVKAVQHALNELGQTPELSEDGQMGAATESAVKQFQASHGLAVDGVIGPNTRSAILHELSVRGLW